MSIGYWLLITFGITFVTSIGLSIWDSIVKERKKAENNDEEYSESKDYTIRSKSEKKKKHSKRCDGDCANCPAHYGYRYGRWYYGHSHTEGCEFGGNKCNGGRD